MISPRDVRQSLPRAPILPMGDSAFVVRFGDSVSPELHGRVMGAMRALDEARAAGGSGARWLVDIVPGYASVMVVYDAAEVEPGEVERWLEEALSEERPAEASRRVVEVPVWYDPSVGLDLEALAREKGMTAGELVALHTAPEYLVYMIGFRPGFPFLGGLDPRLSAPRLATPRAAVPAGSVGIGGQQTGVYPQRSPGGWRLIGRTPLKLFSPGAEAPFLLGAGDRVRFVSVAEAEYRALGGEEAA